jgi:diguanylate cyclase (GGDEF)-like protein
MVVPMYKYLDLIVSSKSYNILFHLDGLYSYYCIDLNENGNENFNSILTKFYNRYSNKANTLINKYFLEIYYNTKGYTELQKESIVSDDFIVGYIDNLPFEGEIASKFTGLTDTYLSKFSTMTGATYKYIGYKDTKELTRALEDKKIDLALNYYSISNDNYINTRTLGPSGYVVLAHDKNNIVVNSLYSLVDSNISMLNNMNLKYNMASKNLFEITDYTSVKSLLKNAKEDTIIIIEKEVYDYYKDSSLRHFSIRYYDTIKLNNTFLLNKDNSAFNELFDFYLSTLSSNEVKNESVVGVIATLKSNRIIDFIISNLLFIVIGLLVISFLIYIIIKKQMNSKRIKKEDRLYYFDAMTNLKNRNYLNDNIDFWSSTKVYPQAIVVIDINKLKVLNDKVGHEAGDAQIKAVASVLIKTQRDNSEIMRTDGDEFIVYLVGYDEKKIGTYIHKLNREFSSTLPNKEYGVSIGYKMITSEEMNIDDAINDALNMINKNKKEL